MNRVPSPLTIHRPCHMDWNTMSGDARRRFCEQCGRHVHNLSAMTKREQQQFAKANGERECIAYVEYPDKTIAARSWRDWLAALFKPVRWALASILSFAAIGCKSTGSNSEGGNLLAGRAGRQEPHLGKKVRGDQQGRFLIGDVCPLPTEQNSSQIKTRKEVGEKH